MTTKLSPTIELDPPPNPGNPRRVRHFLREWREAKGLSQEELAKRLDTSKGVISRYETGERSMNIETQFRVSAALGIWVGELFLPPDKPSTDALLANQPREIWQHIHGIAKATVKPPRRR